MSYGSGHVGELLSEKYQSLAGGGINRPHRAEEKEGRGRRRHPGVATAVSGLNLGGSLEGSEGIKRRGGGKREWVCELKA